MALGAPVLVRESTSLLIVRSQPGLIVRAGAKSLTSRTLFLRRLRAYHDAKSYTQGARGAVPRSFRKICDHYGIIPRHR